MKPSATRCQSPTVTVDPLPYARITELLQLATAILRGDITGEPTQTFLGAGLCAKAATCAINYNPNKLG